MATQLTYQLCILLEVQIKPHISDGNGKLQEIISFILTILLQYRTSLIDPTYLTALSHQPHACTAYLLATFIPQALAEL